MQKSARVLVIGPSWVGDMVMAQSLFITLKNANPDCSIDVLAPAFTLSLLERMPEVAHALSMPLTHGQFGLFDRIKLGKDLRAQAYNQVIVLPNSWKSALIPWFANIPLRTGYVGECRYGLLNDARKLDKSKLSMTVQRFVALGLPKDSHLPPDIPVPSMQIDPAKQQAALGKFSLNASGKILALCPGAEYGPAKRWPVAYFAGLARQKLAEGWQVWLFGSNKDKALTDYIAQENKQQCSNLAGLTSVAEAVDLMSLVSVVVSNDSGLMHVAAALNKKLIAVYGSSDPHFTPPLNADARIVSLNLECAPCFKRDCPLGHTRCLNDIKPEQVLQLIG